MYGYIAMKLDHFDPGAARPLNFEIIRCFQDGADTFVQSVQMPQREHDAFVTMSLIRNEPAGGGRVLRQVTSPLRTPVQSARTMATGPRNSVQHELTQRNRARALDFFETVLVKGDLGRLDDFVPWGEFTSHHPEAGFGRDGFHRLIDSRFDNPEPLRYHGQILAVADGNFVAIFAQNSFEGRSFRVCDLFRMAYGNIVEHWDAVQEADRYEIADNDS